jgi:ferric-dicitrate binding protein FerR (iron transport regulator)
MKTLSLRNSNRNLINLKLTVHGRRAAALLIAVALLSLSLPLFPIASAEPGRDLLGVTGIIRVSGTVNVDGVRGMSGQTVFPGSQIATAEDGESIIDLGRATRLRLGPETDLALGFSRASISSTLGRGIVRGFIPAGLPVNIRTAGGELVTDPAAPAEFIVEVIGENTKVSVKTGRVELRTDGKVQIVGAGGVFTTNAGQQDPPDTDDDGLTKGQKIGIIAAIAGAGTLLLVLLEGREKKVEPEFGGCVIILSGPSSGICP